MTGGVQIFCFAASYAVALALELVGLWRRPSWHRAVVGIVVFAGFIAHTWYLAARAAATHTAPLSSPHDWYLLAAWVLALAYVAAATYYPRRSFGLFLLPPILGLIFVATRASVEPIPTFAATRFWGRIHGLTLMLGTVAVQLGFVAGLMYLLASWRLKRKLPADNRFRLPSLEWLEMINSRSLRTALVLVAAGFVTGVLMRMAGQGNDQVPWTDPVVLSLAGMLGWLAAAEVFRFVYPGARRGRKVAYLTLAAFGFLVITLAMFARRDSLHGEGKAESGEPRTPEKTISFSVQRAGSSPSPEHREIANLPIAISDLKLPIAIGQFAISSSFDGGLP